MQSSMQQGIRQHPSQHLGMENNNQMGVFSMSSTTNNSPEKGNQKAGQVGNHSGLGARGRLNLGVARWTDHVRRGAADGHHRGHNRGIRRGCRRNNGRIWTHGLHPSHRLLV